MKLTTTAIKITGTPTSAGWTQVHEFCPEDEEKFISRGRLYAVLATKRKEEGTDSVVAGRELLSRLHEEYFGNLEASAFSALKSAVEKVIKEFSEIYGEVEIATTVVLGDVVYSAAGGGGRVSIYRDGNIAPILESTISETVTASGYPKAKDLVILGTKSFFETVSHGVLKASLEGADLQSSIESLAPLVHASANADNLGVVVVRFSEASLITAVAESVKLPKVNFKETLTKAFSFLKKIIPEKVIFVKREKLAGEEEKKGSRVTFTVGAILLILLLASIGFGIKVNRDKKFKASYREDLVQAESNLNQAEQLIISDPIRARELFFAGQEKVTNLVARKIEDKDLTFLAARYGEKEGPIAGVYRTDPELYMDLSLLSSGFSGDKIIASGEKLFVLDKNGKRIVGITIATKKTSLLAGSDRVEGIVDFLAYDEDVYGLFNDGIYLLGEKKERVLDKDWDGTVLPYAYAGNIYLLDKTASTIWRYPGVEGKYTVRTSWLASGINIDFSKSKQIVIDGSFWILSGTSKITKLASGNPQNFNLAGVSPEAGEIKSIYAREEQKYLYLLAGNRILVTDKNGNFQSQYQSDKISEATGLIVSEKDKKIILLAKDKLYVLEVKHLD